MQYNYLTAETIYLYSGSTFDGCLILQDIHGQPYLLSEDEKIFFFIEEKNVGKPSNHIAVEQILTKDDETAGKYPFRISHKATADLSGDYYYYAFIQFSDGDRYQIVPHSDLHASIPYASVDYWENKNTIYARIPRIMRKCKCHDETDYISQGGESF